MEQRTNEWHLSRLGKLTASRFGDAIETLKNGARTSKSINYMYELLAERLTGQQADFYVNKAMAWGIEQETDARTAYELETKQSVIECGFIDVPNLPMCGASPDGLVGDDGLVEIKCPNSTTFIKWVLLDEIPPEHKAQMALQLLATGRKWCDFVAYDPRMKSFKIIVKRYEPTADELKEYHDKAIDFLIQLAELEEKFKDKEPLF
jgi:putative phage-type endonuclease